MQLAAASRSHFYKYCTLRYVVDHDRDIEIPVGVAIWGKEPEEFYIRLPQSGEGIPDIARRKAAPYIEAVEAQIREWVNTKDLPYMKHEVDIFCDEWWNHVRKLLRFKVRLDEPKPIDCVEPSAELEALFEAAVKPKQPRSVRKERLDTALNQALEKDVNKQLLSEKTIYGFKERPVTVRKCMKMDNRWLVVEAVNLATQDAERDADALASKVLRIKDGPCGKNVRFAIGYIASPNGLNGERVMKDWIEKHSDTRLYDLVREKNEFNNAVIASFSSLDSQSLLFNPETISKP